MDMSHALMTQFRYMLLILYAFLESAKRQNLDTNKIVNLLKPYFKLGELTITNSKIVNLKIVQIHSIYQAIKFHTVLYTYITVTKN